MQKYFLHINEPCSENWEQMTPTEKGRFCASCQKTVFDFTTASDNDIIKHIEKMKGNMFCGQFEEGQLNRWMEKTNLQTSNPALYKYLLSFLLLTAGQNVMAQKEPAKQENVIPANKMDSAKMESAVIAENAESNCLAITTKDTTAKKIILRGGVASIRTGDENLIIVDGKAIKQSELKNLNTANIKSVNVLKGLQAAAMYGSEDANGVILITTKKATMKKKVKKHSSK